MQGLDDIPALRLAPFMPELLPRGSAKPYVSRPVSPPRERAAVTSELLKGIVLPTDDESFLLEEEEDTPLPPEYSPSYLVTLYRTLPVDEDQPLFVAGPLAKRSASKALPLKEVATEETMDVDQAADFLSKMVSESTYKCSSDTPFEKVRKAELVHRSDAYFLLDASSVTLKDALAHTKDERQLLLIGAHLNHKGLIDCYFQAAGKEAKAKGSLAEIDALLQDEAMCIAATAGNSALLKHIMDGKYALYKKCFSLVSTLRFLVWTAVGRLDPDLLDILLPGLLRDGQVSGSFAESGLLQELDAINWQLAAPACPTSMRSYTAYSSLYLQAPPNENETSMLRFLVETAISQDVPADGSRTEIQNVLAHYVRFLCSEDVDCLVQEITRGSPSVLSLLIGCAEPAHLALLLSVLKASCSDGMGEKKVFAMTQAPTEEYASHTSLALAKCSPEDTASQAMVVSLLDSGAYISTKDVVRLLSGDCKLSLLKEKMPSMLGSKSISSADVLASSYEGQEDAATVAVIFTLLEHGEVTPEIAATLPLAPICATEKAPCANLKKLLALGAKPGVAHPATQEVALHGALRGDNRVAVPILLEAGAGIDKVNADGLSPFRQAVRGNLVECFKSIFSFMSASEDGVKQMAVQVKTLKKVDYDQLKSKEVRKLIKSVAKLEKADKEPKASAEAAESPPKNAEPARKKKKKGKSGTKSKFWDELHEEKERTPEEIIEAQLLAEKKAAADEAARLEREAAEAAAAERAAAEAERLARLAREEQVPPHLFDGASMVGRTLKERIIDFFNTTEEERAHHTGEPIQEIVLSEQVIRERGNVRTEQVIFEMNCVTGDWRKYSRVLEDLAAKQEQEEAEQADVEAAIYESGLSDSSLPVAPAPPKSAPSGRKRISALLNRRDTDELVREIEALAAAEEADRQSTIEIMVAEMAQVEEDNRRRAPPKYKGGLKPFEGLPWKLHINRTAAESWVQLSGDSRGEAALALAKLAQGEWESATPTLPGYGFEADEVDHMAKVFMVNFGKHGRILWQAGIGCMDGEGDTSDVFTEVIRIWAILWAEAPDPVLRRIVAAHPADLDPEDFCCLEGLPIDENSTAERPPREFVRVKDDLGDSDSLPEAFLVGTVSEVQCLVEKFYPLSTRLVSAILRTVPTPRTRYTPARDVAVMNVLAGFGISLTRDQLAVAHGGENVPSVQLLLGLAGTGKTTTLAHRIAFLSEKHAKDSVPYRLMYVASNGLLVEEVARHFNRLTHPGVDVDVRRALPSYPRLSSFPGTGGPLFTSWRKLVLMLDSCLAMPFFPRNKDGSLHQTSLYEGKGELQSRRTTLSLHPVELASPAENCTDVRVEVDYQLFSQMVWPNLVGTAANVGRFPAILVYQEIMGVIKGSRASLVSANGCLSRDQYIAESKKHRRPFLRECAAIYSIFEEYELFKEEQIGAGLFDWADVVFHCYRNRDTYQGHLFDLAAFDGIEDLTQAELLLFTSLSKSLLLSGDSHSGWVRQGTGVKFDDVLSLSRPAPSPAWNLSEPFWESLDGSATFLANLPEPSLYEFSTDFRSHAGIAASTEVVKELLESSFPGICQDLPEVVPPIAVGPLPVLFRPTNIDCLLPLLYSGTKCGTPIELGARQVVLVRTPEARDSLPEDLQGCLCLTLFEAKGLEFDRVLLYNFFSNSPVRDSWASLPFLTADQSPTGAPALHFHDPSLQSLGVELQAFYSAVTRARSCLWVFDDDVYARTPMFSLLEAHGLANVVDMSAVEELAVVAAEAEERGMQLLFAGFFQEAFQCYSKANTLDLAEEAMGHTLVKEARSLGHYDEDLVKWTYLEAASRFVKQHMYSEACKSMLEAGIPALAKLLADKAGSEDLIAACDAVEAGAIVPVVQEAPIASWQAEKPTAGLAELEEDGDCYGWLKLRTSMLQVESTTDAAAVYSSPTFASMLNQCFRDSEPKRIKEELLNLDIPVRVLCQAAGERGSLLVDHFVEEGDVKMAVEVLMHQGLFFEGMQRAEAEGLMDVLCLCTMAEVCRLNERRTKLARRQEKDLHSAVHLVVQQQSIDANLSGMLLAAFGEYSGEAKFLEQACDLLEKDDTGSICARIDALHGLLANKQNTKSIGSSFRIMDEVEAHMAEDVLLLLLRLASFLTDAAGHRPTALNLSVADADYDVLRLLLAYLGLEESETHEHYVSNPILLRGTLFRSLPDAHSVTRDFRTEYHEDSGTIAPKALLEHALERTYVATRFWLQALQQYRAAAPTLKATVASAQALAGLMSLASACGSLYDVYSVYQVPAEVGDSPLLKRLCAELSASSDSFFSIVQNRLEAMEGTAKKLFPLLYPADSSKMVPGRSLLIENLSDAQVAALQQVVASSFPAEREGATVLDLYKTFLLTDSVLDMVMMVGALDDGSVVVGEREVPAATLLILAHAHRKRGEWVAAVQSDLRYARRMAAPLQHQQMELLERCAIWCLVHISSNLVLTSSLFDAHMGRVADHDGCLRAAWASQALSESSAATNDAFLLLAQVLGAMKDVISVACFSARAAQDKTPILEELLVRGTSFVGVLLLSQAAFNDLPAALFVSKLLPLVEVLYAAAVMTSPKVEAGLLMELRKLPAASNLAKAQKSFGRYLATKRNGDELQLVSLSKDRASIQTEPLRMNASPKPSTFSSSFLFAEAEPLDQRALLAEIGA